MNVVDFTKTSFQLNANWKSPFLLLQAFNPDNEYHFKNRMKMCQKNWVEVFGEGNTFAVSPASALQKVSGGHLANAMLCNAHADVLSCVSQEPHGWLVDLVNKVSL